MRTIPFGCFLALLGVAACGETARRGKQAPTAGDAGAAAGGGPGEAGQGGSSSAGDAAGGSSQVQAGAGGERTGVGGEGGGGLEPLPDHSLTLVPPLPAPQTVPPGADIHDDDEITFSLEPRAVSTDGSMVIGISTAIFRHLTGPISYKHQELAVWTAQGGTKRIPLVQENPTSPMFPASFCLAEDGSSFIASPAMMPTSRWTAQNGLTPYATPNGVSAFVWNSCSGDGKRASFNGQMVASWVALYWAESAGAAPGVATLPDERVTGSRLLLSLDEPGGVLTVGRELDDTAPTIYLLSDDGQTEPLASPPGATCSAQHISADGSRSRANAAAPLSSTVRSCGRPKVAFSCSSPIRSPCG